MLSTLLSYAKLQKLGFETAGTTIVRNIKETIVCLEDESWKQPLILTTLMDIDKLRLSL